MPCPGDRKQPRRYRGAGLEPVGVPPHLKENVRHDVLGDGAVLDFAQHETENAHIVTNEQNLHRLPVTLRDASN